MATDSSACYGDARTFWPELRLYRQKIHSLHLEGSRIRMRANIACIRV